MLNHWLSDGKHYNIVKSPFLDGFLTIYAIELFIVFIISSMYYGIKLIK